MSICPEDGYRASLNDEEFWQHVAKNLLDKFDVEYEEQEIIDTVKEWINQPDSVCTVCGSTGACGYDSLGRPMIHTESDDKDGDED